MAKIKKSFGDGYVKPYTVNGKKYCRCTNAKPARIIDEVLCMKCMAIWYH